MSVDERLSFVSGLEATLKISNFIGVDPDLISLIPFTQQLPLPSNGCKFHNENLVRYGKNMLMSILTIIQRDNRLMASTSSSLTEFRIKLHDTVINSLTKKIEKSDFPFPKSMLKEDNFKTNIIYAVFGILYINRGINGLNVLRTWLVANIDDKWFKKVCANSYPPAESIVLNEDMDLDKFIELYNNSHKGNILCKLIHDNMYIEILRYDQQTGHMSSIYSGTMLEYHHDKNHFITTITQRLKGAMFIKGNNAKLTINDNSLKKSKGPFGSEYDNNPVFDQLIKRFKFDRFFPSIDLSLLKLAMMSSPTNNYKLSDDEFVYLRNRYNLNSIDPKILEWYGDIIYNALISEIFREKIGICKEGDKSTFLYTQMIRNTTMAVFGMSLGLYNGPKFTELELISRVRSPAADTLESIFGVLFIQYGIKAFGQVRKWFESLEIYKDIYLYINKDFSKYKDGIYFSQFLVGTRSPLCNYITDFILPPLSPDLMHTSLVPCNKQDTHAIASGPWANDSRMTSL